MERIEELQRQLSYLELIEENEQTEELISKVSDFFIKEIQSERQKLI
jgi:hypothetical protein